MDDHRDMFKVLKWLKTGKMFMSAAHQKNSEDLPHGNMRIEGCHPEKASKSGGRMWYKSSEFAKNKANLNSNLILYF